MVHPGGEGGAGREPARHPVPNALFRVGGVPVLCLPFFAHPDPTVERASGFLVPIPSYDEARGLASNNPICIVVSPSEDWLISPQINTEVAPFLNLQWRRRFGDGIVVARAGYTYERNFGDFDPTAIDRDIRFGDRPPQLSAGLWRGSIRPGHGAGASPPSAHRTRRCSTATTSADPYQDNGLYYGDRRRLISRSTPSIRPSDPTCQRPPSPFRACVCLEVRSGEPGLNNVFERDGVTAGRAPLIEAQWEPRQGVLGRTASPARNAAVADSRKLCRRAGPAPGSGPLS